MTRSDLPTGTVSMGSMTMTGSAVLPSGSAPAGGPGGSTAMTDDSTFLRGGWTTDNNGIVEFMTIYPGFYSGRTAHIHMMVHTDFTVSENG
jgi:hypothetical protein